MRAGERRLYQPDVPMGSGFLPPLLGHGPVRQAGMPRANDEHEGCDDGEEESRAFASNSPAEGRAAGR